MQRHFSSALSNFSGCFWSRNRLCSISVDQNILKPASFICILHVFTPHSGVFFSRQWESAGWSLRGWRLGGRPLDKTDLLQNNPASRMCTQWPWNLGSEPGIGCSPELCTKRSAVVILYHWYQQRWFYIDVSWGQYCLLWQTGLWHNIQDSNSHHTGMTKDKGMLTQSYSIGLFYL